LKVGSRKELTISRIGLAVALDMNQEGIITYAEVVAGAVSTIPLHVEAAEDYLPGKRLDADARREVGKALSDLILKVNDRPRRFYKASAAYGIAEDVLNMFF